MGVEPITNISVGEYSPPTEALSIRGMLAASRLFPTLEGFQKTTLRTGAAAFAPADQTNEEIHGRRTNGGENDQMLPGTRHQNPKRLNI